LTLALLAVNSLSLRWRAPPGKELEAMPNLLEKAPDFKASAVVGRGELAEVSLSEQRRKWVLLFFYPLDFTSICPTEILQLSRRIEEFNDLDTQIIGISCDSQFSHKAWVEHSLGEVAFPLVADFTKEIARSYGALLSDGFPSRATFIIDPDGVIQYASFHNPSVGRSVNELLRVLEAVQTGRRCPVDWKRGDRTLE
jgi:alkyl hydroperoxide reductase subunit AhpC